MSRAAQLECALFVAGEPLPAEEIARVVGCRPDEVVELVDELRRRLDDQESGLQIARIAAGFQLCTRPAYADTVGRLLSRQSGRLSRAALETLAIIAYRQPVTIAEIDAVRGVGSASVLRTLLDRGLIAEAGRRPTLGRPILYATTTSFLHYFALGDLSDLPPLEEPVQDAPTT